jgi:alpha/beta superfamily hydrolase
VNGSSSINSTVPAEAPAIHPVHPFFFNGDQKRLFGAYYEPATSEPAGLPVLICPPTGHEYVRCYNAIRKLCGRLAQSGFGVFKFDYCGLGDSYGDGADADVPEFRDNIRAAAAELARRTGADEITIVGVRFGATLAAGMRFEGITARNLVLWDPVVNGASYLAALRDLHQACLVDSIRYRKLQPRRTTEDELLGFRYPAKLQSSMSQMTLLNKPFPYNNCFLLTSSPSAEYDELTQSLSRNTRGRFTHECVQEPAGWDDVRQVESALAASRAVTAISAKMAGGFV